MDDLIDAFAFAPMKYLDEELKRFEDGYPNRQTEDYYEALKRIRSKQNTRQPVPSFYYEAVGATKGLGTPEYGYYIANIHYYIYESCSEY